MFIIQFHIWDEMNIWCISNFGRAVSCQIATPGLPNPKTKEVSSRILKEKFDENFVRESEDVKEDKWKNLNHEK